MAADECDHGYPYAVVSVDVVVTPKLKSDPICMTVDRHCDCILCGPFVARMKVIRETVVRRGQVIDRWQEWIDQETKRAK